MSVRYEDLTPEQRVAARFIADMFREWRDAQEGGDADGVKREDG